MWWEGSSFPGLVPSDDAANSESVMGIKPGDSGVVIGYQVDEFTHTWSAEQFVAHSHIYPGFTGKVLSLTHFLLEPGCEDYAFLDQAVADFEHLKRKNLTKEEYQSIKSLRNHPDIIIKPADKGSAIVILDKHNYIAEGERQLQNEQFYAETNSDHTGEVIHRVKLFMNNMLQWGQITQKTSSHLTTDIDRTQQFYLLPKIHKDMSNPPGRPIVSGSGGPTEKIS